MGGAGGEGFVPALRRARAPDGEQEAGVGDNDGQDRGHYDEANAPSHHLLVEPGVGAREQQEWRSFTVEMIDEVWATESELEESAGVHKGIQAAGSAGTRHQLETDPTGHGSRVVQGLTDGHVAIVCHDGQETSFRGAKHCKEEKLRDAAVERNDISLRKETHQELRHDG